jgi:hypothetical protein
MSQKRKRTPQEELNESDQLEISMNKKYAVEDEWISISQISNKYNTSMNDELELNEGLDTYVFAITFFC